MTGVAARIESLDTISIQISLVAPGQNGSARIRTPTKPDTTEHLGANGGNQNQGLHPPPSAMTTPGRAAVEACEQ